MVAFCQSVLLERMVMVNSYIRSMIGAALVMYVSDSVHHGTQGQFKGLKVLLSCVYDVTSCSLLQHCFIHIQISAYCLLYRRSDDIV